MVVYLLQGREMDTSSKVLAANLAASQRGHRVYPVPISTKICFWLVFLGHLFPFPMLECLKVLLLYCAPSRCDFSAANWNISGSQTGSVTAVNNTFKQIVCYVAEEHRTIILTFLIGILGLRLTDKNPINKFSNPSVSAIQFSQKVHHQFWWNFAYTPRTY